MNQEPMDPLLLICTASRQPFYSIGCLGNISSVAEFQTQAMVASSFPFCDNKPTTFIVEVSNNSAVRKNELIDPGSLFK